MNMDNAYPHPPKDVPEHCASFRLIPIDKIVGPDGGCPDGKWHEGVVFGYDNMYNDIKKNGLKTPIDVKPIGDGLYKILNGRHRIACLRALGWKEIPCNVF
jgi:hypothetical protein